MAERSKPLRDFLFGPRLSNAQDQEQRIGPLAGVGVLGLDALASAAYGPEALLSGLRPLGAGGLGYVPPLTLAIIALLALVALSYRQTIQAYPNGGGAYTVAKENIGRKASLLAAAALALDYLLNTAVAISAGVGALVSVLPALLPHTLWLCLLVLLLLTVINLRGIRTTGFAFLLPTWLFIACMAAVIGLGLGRAAAGSAELASLASAGSGTVGPSGPALHWLLLHAFANGCTAMTGIEAVSNGVPLFREPRTTGARRTLTLIVLVLIGLLAGIAALSLLHGISAKPAGEPGYRSVLSQLAAAELGQGPVYYVTMASIVAVVLLSANTSFAGFPRVCRMLAADGFLPEPFVHRGRRLAFSHGIVVLALLAGALLIVFGGLTEGLIPLFAIGALFAFTMSQLGMIAHWQRATGRGRRRSLLVNALGALGTGATLCVVLVAKFSEGAWITLLLVGGMLLVFNGVRRHYEFVARATATDLTLDIGPAKPPVALIPIRRWDTVTLKALRFAVGFTPDVVTIQVLTGDREVDDLSGRWSELVEEPARHAGIEPPRLVVRRSEYRELFAPILECATELAARHPGRQIAVIVPQLVERRWYHYLLHNQTAPALNALLLLRGGPQIVVINTPWHLRDWVPERQRLYRRARWSWARRRRSLRT